MIEYNFDVLNGQADLVNDNDNGGTTGCFSTHIPTLGFNFFWRPAMCETARELLREFDALPPSEQHLVAVEEISRRCTSDQGLSDAALEELAADLFRSYDAEEAAGAAP